MTFPAKENLIYFEELAKKQTQIYQDACDAGVDLTLHPVKDEARENLMALMEIYKYKLVKPQHARYPYDTDWTKCSTTTLFIPFEKDEGYFSGIELTIDFMTISYLKGQKVDKEFLSINIRRHAQKENPYQPIKEKSNADKWAENARDAKRFN